MPLDSVREWLIGNASFQRLLSEVIVIGVLDEFPNIRALSDFPECDWSRLLLWASVFARSDKANEQRIALRIADTCLKVSLTTKEERSAAAVILDIMANRRSLDLAKKRELVPVDLEVVLPLPLQADFLKRSAEDQIQSSDNARHPANRFQVEFWDALNKNQWISASAPTSAGKSFMLRSWVAELFRRNNRAFIAFIVPTRALIQEFSDDFSEDITRGILAGVSLHSLPLQEEFDPDSGHLFVFTQERLHILLSRSRDMIFDLVVVDEAQKVGDGYRGVLLEQVIGECMRRSRSTQVVHASPFVENPSYLNRSAPARDRSASVDREVTTVTQNLLFASQKRGAPDIWDVSFISGETELPIGSVRLPFRAATETKRLSTVAFALQSRSGGNLVYANGPAKAEDYAQHISEGFRSQNFDSLEEHPRVANLVALVRKTIHPKYRLADTLKNGVAFHYGNMPLLIRTEIEALFRENILRFLVCTATLIEGVNLPCKAIFLRGPTKGNGKPMLPVDFWNLAGRAGRWGTEFHGSIICVDPNRKGVWVEPPPRERVRQRVLAATEHTLRSVDEVIDYVASGYRGGRDRDYALLDYTLTFLFHSLLRGESLSSLPSASIIEDSKREALKTMLRQELAALEIPSDMIFRHPGVLPHALADLLSTFRSMDQDELLALAPVLPESDNAVEVYTAIFRFIDAHLRAGWSHPADFEGKRLMQLAITAVDWMRGMPLAVLIRKRERRNATLAARGEKSLKLSRIIINVMSDVEEYARFKIPKYLRAFLDVFYFHTRETGVCNEIRELPNLELWLELGVSVRTQLSLMELGMSRTATIEVFEVMMDDNMSRTEALSWLREAPPSVFINLPELVRQEISRILGKFDTTPPVA